MRLHRIAILATGLAATVAVAAGPGPGLRFDSPQVLDLALVPATVAGHAVPLGPLPIDAPSEAPSSSGLLTTPDDPSGERGRVAAEAAHVERAGPWLRIVPEHGDPVDFVDWSHPATRDADGDAATHVYLGRLEGSGYHRVEVQFGQDSPGSFLVDPASGRTAFVHEGSDVVALSPDGLALVTFNADNPPLSLRVAALDASGPRLALSCVATALEPRAEPAFVGWRGAHRFDLALAWGDGGRERMRFAREGADWTVAASNPARLAALGFACRQLD